MAQILAGLNADIRLMEDRMSAKEHIYEQIYDYVERFTDRYTITS